MKSFNCLNRAQPSCVLKTQHTAKGVQYALRQPLHTTSRQIQLKATDESSEPECVPLPPELQGLSINDQGFLIDEKSGKVVNNLGATRFDVAVSAMRGLLDPPAWVENSEKTPGLIIGSLVQFPTKYCFSVVGSNTQEFQDHVIGTVARMCQAEIDTAADVRRVERLGGKFISMQIDAMVRAPEIISMVLEELGKDPRVKMRY